MGPGAGGAAAVGLREGVGPGEGGTVWGWLVCGEGGAPCKGGDSCEWVPGKCRVTSESSRGFGTAPAPLDRGRPTTTGGCGRASSPTAAGAARQVEAAVAAACRLRTRWSYRTAMRTRAHRRNGPPSGGAAAAAPAMVAAGAVRRRHGSCRRWSGCWSGVWRRRPGVHEGGREGRALERGRYLGIRYSGGPSAFASVRCRIRDLAP